MRKAESQDELVAVTIHTAGPMAGHAEAHITDEHAPFGAYVQVRIGSALLYLYRRAAVESHTAAWCDAAELSAHLLPARCDVLPDGEPVGAVLNVRRAVSTNVHFLPEHVAPNKRPHVRVLAGALRVCVYDSRSLADYVAVWNRARSLADCIFANEPSTQPPLRGISAIAEALR